MFFSKPSLIDHYTMVSKLSKVAGEPEQLFLKGSGNIFPVANFMAEKHASIAGQCAANARKMGTWQSNAIRTLIISFLFMSNQAK